MNKKLLLLVEFDRDSFDIISSGCFQHNIVEYDVMIKRIYLEFISRGFCLEIPYEPVNKFSRVINLDGFKFRNYPNAGTIDVTIKNVVMGTHRYENPNYDKTIVATCTAYQYVCKLNNLEDVLSQINCFILDFLDEIIDENDLKYIYESWLDKSSKDLGFNIFDDPDIPYSKLLTKDNKKYKVNYNDFIHFIDYTSFSSNLEKLLKN